MKYCCCILALLAGAALALTSPQTSREPIFVYHSGFWLSLHHYLYVLGRVEAKMPDIQRRAVAGAAADEAQGLTALSADEREVWKDVVHAYSAGFSRQDAVFDDPMVKAGRALAAARNANALTAPDLDETLRALLERAAPLYRKAWWARHEASNRARIEELDALVQRHGRAILSYLSRAYHQPWPSDGYPVQFTPFSNWAGAFSTRGRHLVFSSLDPGLSGAAGLETLFHEAMHQWDDAVSEQLASAAKQQQKQVPGNLSHAMIFYAAGESVRSVIPDHRTYAETRGMWNGPFAEFKPRLDAVWKPYLAGQGALEDAIQNLLKF
jgi:hypothetical protein